MVNFHQPKEKARFAQRVRGLIAAGFQGDHATESGGCHFVTAPGESAAATGPLKGMPKRASAAAQG